MLHWLIITLHKCAFVCGKIIYWYTDIRTTANDSLYQKYTCHWESGIHFNIVWLSLVEWAESGEMQTPRFRLPYQTRTYSVERSYESEEEHLWCWHEGAVMQPTSIFLQADQLETVMITILILIALLLDSHSHSALKRSGSSRPDTLGLHTKQSAQHTLFFIYILFNCKLHGSFKCIRSSRWWI